MSLQEKDPSAAEAFAAATALGKQSMQSAAGCHTAAHAVDGFVTKLRPTSSAPKAQKGSGTQHTRHKEPARLHESPIANNTLAGSPQPHGQAVQGCVCPPEGPATRLDSDCTSSTQSASPSTDSGLSRSAEAAVTQDTGGLQASEQLQQHRQQHQQPQQQWQQQQQQHNGDRSSMSSSAAPAEAPVLSFEIEDAEGPLEGASNGLAAQFGCLKVINFCLGRWLAWQPSSSCVAKNPKCFSLLLFLQIFLLPF